MNSATKKPLTFSYLIVFNGGDGDISHATATNMVEAEKIYVENNDEGMNGIFRFDPDDGKIVRIV